MTYQEAIEIFDTLDEDARIREVYAHFGLAVYYAQVLEQQCINMIAACKQITNELNSPKEIEELWDEYDFGNRTFGKLIHEMRSLYEFTDEEYQGVKEVLKLRNYIAHNYFRFNAELFYSDSGQKRMIRDFINFQEKAKALDTKLLSHLKIHIDKIGLTEEHVEKIMEQTKDVWTKKVIDDEHETIINRERKV